MAHPNIFLPHGQGRDGGETRPSVKTVAWLTLPLIHYFTVSHSATLQQLTINTSMCQLQDTMYT